MELSKRYLFHPDSITVMAEVFKGELVRAIESLRRPGRRYFLRANTLKVSAEELASRLGYLGIPIYRHECIDEALYMNVEGPLPIPEAGKRVVVD
ncbi:hypothetical protein KEJ35_07155, partial [Candidatus Bathyarchaeota archaeon]|nr:hypothetical protein [Candidatus Bathyarchaeota archaeon]